MQRKPRPIHLVIALHLFALSAAVADSPVTFEIVAAFDYPSATSTFANQLNDQAQVAGTIQIGGAERGFVRLPNGHFTPPIQVSGNSASATDILGINNLGDLCGIYTKGFHNHGFLSLGGVPMDFAIPGAKDTYVFGLNDSGNFCGYSATDSAVKAFVSIDGTVTSFGIADAPFPFAYGINNLNQCVGTYQTGTGIISGFVREADGTLVYPVNAVGATFTDLKGINDQGAMVGSVTTRSGAHGVFFESPTRYATFDYPGALSTTLTGINNQGLITGYYYVDSSGNAHSFLLRVKRNN